MLRRIELVLAMVATVVLLGGGGPLTNSEGASAQEVAAERPNIVFVMTDDLDERSMQDLGGIREVMGSNGVTFENAYVTYALCCPSRATILRGQYAHNHGILDNAPPLGGEKIFREQGRDQSTVATWLNDAGYRTKYVGKYLNGYDDLYIPPGWDEWFVLQGSPKNNEVNDNGQSLALTGHSTDAFADEASDFIRRSSANPEPFFVFVGTKAPHTPPEVANRYQDSFVDTPLPRPPNFNEEDVSDKPQWVRSRKLHSQTAIDNMEQEYRNRLRSMLSVEDLLRQTIATLQETGELDNTYIFFTSDNGFHLGNHRLGKAKRTPYEEDIGVPLMVRGPGVPAGAMRQELIINNDFAPTIADLAGAPTPEFIDGSSFAPLLTASPPSSWRTAFLEEGWYSEVAGFSLPTHKGVHTQEQMFVKYDDTGEHELYDLTLDPYQLESMPQAGNEQLYSELAGRLNDLRDCSGDGCREAEFGWEQMASLPNTTIDSGPSGHTNANSASFSFSSSVAGADFECSLDGEFFGECSSPKEYAGLADGEHTFRVRAIDAAGNADPSPASRTWTVDTASPSIALTAPREGATYALNQTVNADYSCQDEPGGSGLKTCEAPVANGAAIDTGSTGSHTFTVTATDDAGNTNTATRTYTVADDTAAGCTIVGSANGETLTGTAGDDVICARGGNDTIKGLEGNDTINGGGGADTLTGGSGRDTLYGGWGKDSVVGSAGADNLFGEDGDDTVNSRDSKSGNDSLDGGEHVNGDTKVTDATEKSIVGFP